MASGQSGELVHPAHQPSTAAFCRALVLALGCGGILGFPRLADGFGAFEGQFYHGLHTPAEEAASLSSCDISAGKSDNAAALLSILLTSAIRLRAAMRIRWWLARSVSSMACVQ